METKETTKNASKRTVKKQLTLIDAIETIIEKSEDSKLGKELFKEAKREIKFLAESYGISEMQAVLFCVAMEKGPRRISFDDLARYLNINNVRMLQYADDINALIRRRLIRYRDAKDEEQFDIYPPVVKALKHNEVYTLSPKTGLTCEELFEQLNAIFSDLYEDAIIGDEAVLESAKLLEENKQVEFSKQIHALKLTKKEQALVVFFCHLLVNKEDDDIRIGQLEDLICNKSEFQRIKREFRTGEHILFRQQLIEHGCVDGIADNNRYKLTNSAKRTLLAELGVNIADENIANLLQPQQLTAKELFYPAVISNKIDELAKFFTQEHYLQVRERMSSRGFRGGFACLFYGGPGTGKTETVYQLARCTGREIMVVDVPQIKSKWVGDSEKNIKALFDRYRELVKRRELAPILLFNEADAIISTRKSGAQNAVDKMENAIQNIILQEMETLDGIMIATTNLQENLDNAFERRFLYKIKFEKPDAAVRAKIWQQMIPELSENDATTLAAAHDLSGGQIENVARKHSINVVLHGEQENLLENLLKECATERLSKQQQHTRVGF
ncbi:MAG: AAA family ATPase [Bacteroidaceae bacterium]|nr:AAA family ATPase [Bacteroidaceae bacterium]